LVLIFTSSQKPLSRCSKARMPTDTIRIPSRKNRFFEIVW
jgi:hypothetical protein